MDAEGNKQGTGGQGGPGDPRAIGKWARIYAQNRSLSVAVALGFFAVVFLMISGGSYLAGQAYLSGHRVMFGVWQMVALAGGVACIYLAIPWWGGKRLRTFAQYLYDREGNVAISGKNTGKRKVIGAVAAVLFMACIVLSMILEARDYFPHRYQQPCSAIFMVPFLVVIWILIRPAASWLMLLWPALYGLHAVLIVAGMPILFSGRWDCINMLLPTIGYGLLTTLVMHIYSRFALGRLRHLARTDLPADADRGW